MVYDNSYIDEVCNYVALSYERLSELYQIDGLLPKSDTFAKHFKFKAACYDEDLSNAFLAFNENQLKMEEKAVFFLQKGMVFFYQNDIENAVFWLKKAEKYRNKTSSAYEQGLFNEYYKLIGDYYIRLATFATELDEKNKYFKLGADCYLQISANANYYIAMHLEAANIYAECLNDKNKSYDILVKVDQAKSNNYNRGKFSTGLNTINIFYELSGKVQNYYNYLNAWMSKWRNGLTGKYTHEFVEPFNKDRDNPIDGYLFYKNYYGERRKFIMSHARLEKKEHYSDVQLQKLRTDFAAPSAFRHELEQILAQNAAQYPENGILPDSASSNTSDDSEETPRSPQNATNQPSSTSSLLSRLIAYCGFGGHTADEIIDKKGSIDFSTDFEKKRPSPVGATTITTTVPTNIDPLFSCLCAERSQLLHLLQSDDSSKIRVSSESSEALVIYNDEVLYKKLQDIIVLMNNIITYCQISSSNQAPHLAFLNALRALEGKIKAHAISIHLTQTALDVMKTENISCLQQDVQHIRAEQESIKEKLASGELFEEAVAKAVNAKLNEKLDENNRTWEAKLAEEVKNQLADNNRTWGEKMEANNRTWEEKMAEKDQELANTKNDLINTKREWEAKMAAKDKELADTKQELRQTREQLNEMTNTVIELKKQFSEFGEIYKKKTEKARERKLALKKAEPTLKFFKQLNQNHECFTENGNRFSIPDDCFCPITLSSDAPINCQR